MNTAARTNTRRHTEAPSPGVVAFNGSAAQPKLARYESALPSSFNLGDGTGTQGIEVLGHF